MDDLTTSDATKALSAKQGKVLNDAVTSLNARGNDYYTFSGDVVPVYASYKDLIITTNMAKGHYLLMIESDINRGYDNASDILIIYISGVTGGRLIFAPQFRGTVSSGGGTSAWALIEITSETNSLKFTTYGYINASYTQHYAIAAIKLI